MCRKASKGASKVIRRRMKPGRNGWASCRLPARQWLPDRAGAAEVPDAGMEFQGDIRYSGRRWRCSGLFHRRNNRVSPGFRYGRRAEKETRHLKKTVRVQNVSWKRKGHLVHWRNRLRGSADGSPGGTTAPGRRGWQRKRVANGEWRVEVYYSLLATRHSLPPTRHSLLTTGRRAGRTASAIPTRGRSGSTRPTAASSCRSWAGCATATVGTCWDP